MSLVQTTPGEVKDIERKVEYKKILLVLLHLTRFVGFLSTATPISVTLLESNRNHSRRIYCYSVSLP